MRLTLKQDHMSGDILWDICDYINHRKVQIKYDYISIGKKFMPCSEIKCEEEELLFLLKFGDVLTEF